MFAAQTRDLSHIELARSDNISSSSKARTYRVGEAHISTEIKARARIRGENPFILALSVCVGVPRSEIWLWFVPCRGWRPRHPVNQRIAPNVIRASGVVSRLWLCLKVSAKIILHWAWQIKSRNRRFLSVGVLSTVEQKSAITTKIKRGKA